MLEPYPDWSSLGDWFKCYNTFINILTFSPGNLLPCPIPPLPQATTPAWKGVGCARFYTMVDCFPENVHTLPKEIGNSKGKAILRGIWGASNQWTLCGRGKDIYWNSYHSATDIICLFLFFGVVVNRQEIQNRSCACPLDRENLVRNKVSFKFYWRTLYKLLISWNIWKFQIILA